MSASTKKILAAISLLRPFNLLIVVIGVLLSGWLAQPASEQWVPIALTAIAAALIAGAGNAINDYFDAEIDLHNRPERPIPQKHLSPNEAKAIWLIGSLVGLAVSVAVGVLVLAIALFWISSLFLYSYTFKRGVLVGNLLVSVATAMALVAGAAAVGEPRVGMIPAAFAFLATLAREVVKDVEDADGDRVAGAATLPIRFGVRASQTGASVALVALIALTLFVYLGRIYVTMFTPLVIIIDLALVRAIVGLWQDSSKQMMRRLSTELKAIMLGGMFWIFLSAPR